MNTKLFEIDRPEPCLKDASVVDRVVQEIVSAGIDWELFEKSEKKLREDELASLIMQVVSEDKPVTASSIASAARDRYGSWPWCFEGAYDLLEIMLKPTIQKALKQ